MTKVFYDRLGLIIIQWYPEVLHFCPTTPIILVGLKSDLRYKRTCIDLLKTQGLTPVTPAQGQGVASRMGAIYMECSSKEMNGVEEVFEKAIHTAVGEEINSKHPDYSQSSGRDARRNKKGNRCKLL